MAVKVLTSFSLAGMEQVSRGPARLGVIAISPSNHISTGPDTDVAEISTSQLGCSWFAIAEMQLKFCVIGGATDIDDMSLHPS